MNTEQKFDIFKPHSEPAASIYEAFQLEAKNRKGKTVAQWRSAELAAMYFISALKAVEHGLSIPTIEQIIRAEQSASGHTDYGAKWAYGIVEAMRK